MKIEHARKRVRITHLKHSEYIYTHLYSYMYTPLEY